MSGSTPFPNFAARQGDVSNAKVFGDAAKPVHAPDITINTNLESLRQACVAMAGPSYTNLIQQYSFLRSKAPGGTLPGNCDAVDCGGVCDCGACDDGSDGTGGQGSDCGGL